VSSHQPCHRSLGCGRQWQEHHRRGTGRLDPNSDVIHFDRYPVQMPEDLTAWLGDGADFNQWSVPGLADDLARAHDGEGLVVYEAPLGRRHELTGAHIDFLVFIEIPLEIALADWCAVSWPENPTGWSSTSTPTRRSPAASTDSKRVRWRRTPTWWSTVAPRWRPMSV